MVRSCCVFLFCFIAWIPTFFVSAIGASTPQVSPTTIISKGSDFTDIEYVQATVTSYIVAASEFTQLKIDGVSSTKEIIIVPSFTQILQEAPTITNNLYLAPSSTVSVLVSAGSEIEVELGPTATHIYAASASFAVDAPFNETTAYNIDISSLDVFCWYPISGNYGRWPRVLYYVTLLFALLARNHDWLIGGALAAALTYSGGAAIHACLLTWRGPGWGELDLQALIAILSTACIITVPLLNWSKTLRGFGQQKNDKWSKAFRTLGIKKTEEMHIQPARTITLYWGFLVTVGFLCVFVSIWDTELDISPVTYSSSTTLSCVPDKPLDLTAGQDANWTSLYPNQEFISVNSCVDPCQGFDPSGGSIFRSNEDLKILTQHQISSYIGVDAKPREKKTKTFTNGYQKYGLLFVPYILIQGIWTAFFGRRNPIQIRDRVYLFLVRPNEPLWQKMAIKFFSLLIYLWAVFIIVICPPLFILNLVAAELIIAELPQSETARHIGSWGPWATTALVLFAAFVARFHTSVVESLEKIFEYWATQIKHKIQQGAYPQEKDEEKGRSPSSNEETTGQQTQSPKKSVTPHRELIQKTEKFVSKMIKKWQVCLKELFRQPRQALRENWRSTKAFLQDPGCAQNSDRHGNKRPKPTKSIRDNNVDVITDHRRMAPTSDKPVVHRFTPQQISGEQVPLKHTSMFFTSPFLEDWPAIQSSDSFGRSTISSPYSDTDCLLRSYKEDMSLRHSPSSGTTLTPGEQWQSQVCTPSPTPGLFSRTASSSFSTLNHFSDADIEHITHPSVGDRSHTSVSSPRPGLSRRAAVSYHSGSRTSRPFTDDVGRGSRSGSGSANRRRQDSNSTVTYLQIERPRAMVFQDTIMLRKDENGVYHVVENEDSRL